MILNKKIEFKNCTLYHNGDYCTTVFTDGYESSNWPLPKDKSYVQVAEQCGFSNTSEDLMNYCYEHEFFHTWLPLKLFIREGYVITRSAHRIKMSEAAAMAEERLIYYFQRYKAFPDQNQKLDFNWDELVEQANQALYSTTEQG